MINRPTPRITTAESIRRLALYLEKVSLTVELVEQITGSLSSLDTLLAQELPQPAGTPPAPGQFWPEHNAWYAGITCKPDGTAWHLLLPKDVAELPDQPWGESGQLIDGASCRFDGLANTAAMAAAGNALARSIQTLPGDCYLPSLTEAAVLHATVREHLPAGYHWTSTQHSADFAFVQDFESGYSYWNYKDNAYRVRAVRRIPLQPFTPSALEAAPPSTSEGGAA